MDAVTIIEECMQHGVGFTFSYAPLPPGAQAISVTEEERDAIERVG